MRQNFLRNRRTARKLTHLAGTNLSLPCVDIGAGNGSITSACLDIRIGQVVAIEMDKRLSNNLQRRFTGEPRLRIVTADLRTVEPPSEPFVIAANPPFNSSTFLARRWLMHCQFRSGAMIVETSFGERIRGYFGATKVSLSLAPFLDLDLVARVSPHEFQPRPNTSVSILTAARRQQPLIAGNQRDDYLLFVNALFERGSKSVQDTLAYFRIRGAPRPIQNKSVSQLTVIDACELYRLWTKEPEATRRVTTFDADLPPQRQPDFG